VQQTRFGSNFSLVANPYARLLFKSDYSQSVAFVFGPCNNNTIGKVYRGWKMNERWMIIHIIGGRDSLHVVIYYPISLSLRGHSRSIVRLAKSIRKILTHLETSSLPLALVIIKTYLKCAAWQQKWDKKHVLCVSAELKFNLFQIPKTCLNQRPSNPKTADGTWMIYLGFAQIILLLCKWLWEKIWCSIKECCSKTSLVQDLLISFCCIGNYLATRVKPVA